MTAFLYFLAWTFAWGFLAFLLAVVVGNTISTADRIEQPEPTETYVPSEWLA